LLLLIIVVGLFYMVVDFPWSPHVVATRPDVYPALPTSTSGWCERTKLVCISMVFHKAMHII